MRPKPMVEIGGKPILWHIMKMYSAHGIDDFIVCLGYKGYIIKEFFANYRLHTGDVTFDLAQGSMSIHRSAAEDWTVTLVETGEATMTGGRLKRVLPYIGEEDFCFTYGDGLSNLDITALIAQHRSQGVLATVTAVQPVGRFGALELDERSGRVQTFVEKPRGDGGWINGGFFVLSSEVGRYIDGDATVWEQEPVEALAAAGQLSAYFHRDFWLAMDTLRDRKTMQELWESGRAPWRTWE